MTAPGSNPAEFRPPAPRATSPDFDGHLEWPLERMSTEQRLDWLTQAALLMLEARAARDRAAAQSGIDGGE